MNITLNCDELMYLFELVMRRPMSDQDASEKLLHKLKAPILSALEREDDRRSKEAYANWISLESKRLKDLDNRNVDLKKVSDIKNTRPTHVGEGI